MWTISLCYTLEMINAKLNQVNKNRQATKKKKKEQTDKVRGTQAGAQTANAKKLRAEKTKYTG